MGVSLEELRTNPWDSSMFPQDPQRGPSWAFFLALLAPSGGGHSQGGAESSPGGPRRTPCIGRPLSRAALRPSLWPTSPSLSQT